MGSDPSLHSATDKVTDAIAIAERDGPERGLEVLHAIENPGPLRLYPFYPAAIGELELRRGNLDVAQRCFSSAAALARNPIERRFLETRARACVAHR